MNGEGTIAQVLAGEAGWAAVHADCRELLRSLPDCSVDSVVTDPPYELGFMSRAWDRSGVAFDPAIWVEVLRVLKPGGHLLAFGGTRTYHRMTCAIEDAGFEIRDSIHWLYGSGFPKSLNVSKAIDAMRGAEPTVVGSRVLTGNAAIPCAEKGGTYTVGSPPSAGRTKTIPITAPTTPEAREWSGWGTALKPGHEPIVMARKPFAGTVAENVLAHNTGAINIDRCRIGIGSDKTPAPTARGDSVPSFTTADPEQLGGDDTVGRWPANVVFTHSAGCQRVGALEVERQHIEKLGSGSSNVYGAGLQRSRSLGTTTESVPTYDCVDDCPVRALESQSTKTTTPNSVTRGAGGQHGAFQPIGEQRDIPSYGDTGTAARFFPCFEWSPEHDDPAVWPPFRYEAKASTSEREAGCDRLPKTEHGRANTHPTVKPYELLRYLCRLVTRPRGVVLDLYMGSGSGGVACVVERLRFIGGDMVEAHVAIARARIDHWEPRQLGLFEDTGS